MSIRERMSRKKDKLKAQYQRGKERTAEMKAEKRRRKMNNLIHMKPGARKAIFEGVATRKSIKDVMRDEYYRRKYEREKKYKS